MKQRYLMALLILLACLPACAPGHVGSNVVAFIRDGQLWTADPNGANAEAIVVQDTPVIGYSWAPAHQMLTFRALDEDFAKTAAARQLVSQPIAGIVQDAPSTENTISVDGGTPMPTAFSNATTSYSNAIWNAAGNRLLYRQTAWGAANDPFSAQWLISQDDQPGIIARKTFPASYTIPSFSYLNQLILGEDDRGIFTTSLAGTNVHYVARRDPRSHDALPTTLQRLLWRPAHQDQGFLYATIDPLQAKNVNNVPMTQLILRTLAGQSKTLATCPCTQFAWSPDGNFVLYATNTAYTILNLQNYASWNITPEMNSIPYWSPDSQFLLLAGAHTLQLLSLTKHRQTTLFSDGQINKSSSASSTNVLPQPAANSPWAADSRHFLFSVHNRLLQANIRVGLYTATIDNDGQVQGAPMLVDAGNDSQAGWTYQDANTSWVW